jgi:uncharacterized protein (TIGR03066 family)
MKSKTRKAKQAPNPQAKAPKPAGGNAASGRKWILMVAAAAVVCAASFAVFEFILPGKIPPELVGEWRVVGGDLSGMTLEFKRNGSMTGKALVNGQENVIEGEAEVTGNTLRTTTTNPFTGKSETGTQTIVTLTETELVTQDAKGTKITMTRVR